MLLFEELSQRGFIEQTTHENEIKNILNTEKITFYIGLDPTADSFHIGHFLTFMVMSHMQRSGHTPIALIGGGTGMVGDPTDKTEMRRVMTKEEVENNVNCLKKQLEKFIDFKENKAILLNNANWLLNLKYIDFIREYGIHFSVNKMITAECYKRRLDKGLSFFEFNYLLMQSYDFLYLNRNYNCVLQIGGSDQWSNIIGGVELLRRADNKKAYGLTLSLLTTNDNKKMGKTEKGAIWLDKEKTTPYEFFQYFRNVSDADVIKFLKLLTFLPIEEIYELEKLKDSQINKAKEILAFEVTKIIHGEEEADKSLKAAKALFEGGNLEGSIPTTILSMNKIQEIENILDLLYFLKLVPSKSEARRLVQQKGIKVNSETIDKIDYRVTEKNIFDGIIVIQKGKKTFHHIKIE